MLRLSLPVLVLLATSSFATANEYADAMKRYLKSEISTWISDPTLIAAISRQNAKTRTYSQAEIEQMDTQWRVQVGTDDAPLVNAILSNSASEFLRERIYIAGGAITEAILMDARGLNVAISEVTSDMWQGDEAKFQETYPKGANAAYFSDIEFDESTQRYQGQISVTVSDPQSGQIIGAITIGVDAEAIS